MNNRVSKISIYTFQSVDIFKLYGYYANGERLATAIGTGGFHYMSPDAIDLPNNREFGIMEAVLGFYNHEYPFMLKKEYFTTTTNETIEGVQAPQIQYQCPPNNLYQLYLNNKKNILLDVMNHYLYIDPHATNETYFTHNDHLGSASWITDIHGSPTQYLHYLPYGQLLVNQRLSTYNERFKFIGKERDGESGYDYFGARYYASPFMHWLSPDPLSDKDPGISSYAYCRWNPIRNVDLYGLDVYRYNQETGDFLLYKSTNDNYDQIGKFRYNILTKQYELRTDKEGNYKTFTNNNNSFIAKGILHDKLNIKSNGENFITDNYSGPSIKDFYDFALLLDNITGREISGYVLFSPYATDKKIVRIEPYLMNMDRTSNNKIYKSDYYNFLEHFHTHGQALSPNEAKTISSEDKRFRQEALKAYPNIQLLILHNYGGPINYTK